MGTTINQASIVIQLLNDFDKSPVLNAHITCNGRHMPFIKKGSGHYIFINIHKGKYIFEINAFGFDTKTLEVDYIDKDKFPQIYTLNLHYKMNHPRISTLKKIVFTLKNKNKLLSNKEVKIRLNTKVPQLRVTDPIKKGSREIYLNCDFNSRFLYQTFNYANKSNLNICFTSYDQEKKSYLNQRAFRSDIEEGELLKPFWEFVTDDNGIFILPMDNLFFQNNKLEFTVYCGRKSTNINVDVLDNTSYIDINI